MESGVAKWIGVEHKFRRSGYSQCWSCAEVSCSRNGYLVHRSKVGSIVASHCSLPPTQGTSKWSANYPTQMLRPYINTFTLPV